MIVFPGIIADTKESFLERLAVLTPLHPDGIHVDIADDVYVPNTTVSVDQLGQLPQDLFFEAHLMVNNPRSYFNVCQKAGFKRVIVHFDALALETYAEILLVQDEVHALGMQFCLAFQYGELIALHEDLCSFDQILIMPIVPGFSGQEFIPEQIGEVRKLRSFCREVPIEVDGHIDDMTVDMVRDAGATCVVSTSYLQGEDIYSRYIRLKG